MKFGIDRLLAEPELRRPLEGKRVALLAHPASVTADLTHSLDALIAAGVNVSADNVPTTQKDFAAHQHMTTFTLGLGLDGTLSYRSDYETANSGDFFAIKQGTLAGSWPNPAAASPTRHSALMRSTRPLLMTLSIVCFRQPDASTIAHHQSLGTRSHAAPISLARKPTRSAINTIEPAIFCNCSASPAAADSCADSH